MSDQQSDPKTVGGGTTEEQQQHEDNIVPSIEANPTGTDKGDAATSPTIEETDNVNGDPTTSPNIDKPDDVVKRNKGRSNLTPSSCAEDPNTELQNID